MDWPRIIGALFGGFTVKAAVCVLAIVLASEAWQILSTAADGISKGFGQ